MVVCFDAMLSQPARSASCRGGILGRTGTPGATFETFSRERSEKIEGKTRGCESGNPFTKWGGHDVYCYMGERLQLKVKMATLHCSHWRPKANSKGTTRLRSGMGNRGPTTAAPAMPFLPCAANNS